MQPYSQPLFFWEDDPPLVANDFTYWFNGLPFPGAKNLNAPTSGMQFWFNGLPVQAQVLFK